MAKRSLGATVHDLRTLECIDCHQHFDTTSSRNYIRCPKCSKENNYLLQGQWRSEHPKASRKSLKDKYIPMTDMRDGKVVSLWLNAKTGEIWDR